MRVVEHWPPIAGGEHATKAVWESTCCLLCGSDRWTPVKDAPPFIDGSEHCQVVRCRDCDLTYTNRRPSAGTIHCFYDNYLPHQSCGMSPREHLRATRRFRIKHFWKSYSPRRDGLPLVGQSRLLDFGCGGGAFLERMHRLGWQVVGLDNSSRVIEQVREKLRLRAFVGTLPHPELASERFEAVSMWHSLEHVHQPLEALRQAWNVLTPDGKLVVGVPNVDGAPRRWYGPAWFCWSLPIHLTHFTAATLRAMVERAGFQTQSVLMRGQTSWLRESAARARQLGLAVGWRGWMTNRPLSRHVSAWLSRMRQSDEIVLIAQKQLAVLRAA